MLENMELRAVYCEEMIKLAEADARIVTVDADLCRAAGMMPFKAKFPGRAFDVGIAEANMVGVAAGLAAMGKVPFAHTFAPFMTRRCFDQITVSVTYAGLCVKFVGSDPGFAAEVNGGTHMSFDDINMMRAVPGMTVVEPCDAAAMRSLLPQIANSGGSVYMRLFRQKPDKVYDEGASLTLGKGFRLKDGGDVAIIASGVMVFASLEAAWEVEKEGISARVIDMHTVKPLDADMVLKAARECGAVLTVENHNIIGGLGSACAEVLAESGVNAKFRRMGVMDRYGEVGFRPYLQEALGLTVADVVRNVKGLLEK